MQSDDSTQQKPQSTSGKPAAQHRSGIQQHSGQDYAKSNLLHIPAITLPKGGGALKGIDEKFSVNAANGTASFSIALPFSKTRSDFSPHLSLNYNSGSGNSPFGLGWNIDLPAIHRRTEKLLPAYMDAEESDVFQFSGAEDLVPSFYQDPQGDWLPDAFPNGSNTVKRYRPRIEVGFSLIEKITLPDNTSYWKITTKDNIVTYFGFTAQGRITDPNDNTHIFKWLPEISFDDQGNCYQYTYVAENINSVIPAIHEKNRLTNPQSFTNTYLKSIQYGNKTPFIPSEQYTPAGSELISYLFGMIVDYGDHNTANPLMVPDQEWASRYDPFSTYKSGFDIRTYRLCRRFLFFHAIDQLNASPCVVKSVELSYMYYNFDIPPPLSDPTLIEAELVTAVSDMSWLGNAASGYTTKALPPVSFTYNLPVWDNEVQEVTPQNLENLPIGLGSNYQFTDLWSEGIPGILTEVSGGMYYKSNLGDGNFTPAAVVAPKPSFTGLSSGNLQLQALEGDGRKFIVSTQPPLEGYFEISNDGEWYPFTPFENYPVTELHDPNLKYIDLDGDGRPDMIISEENAFTWYPSAGMLGYEASRSASKPYDEEKGPAIVFSDPVQSIFLADMTGDGLTDIVRIRNGEICYWPNTGYGLFGAKVNMMNAPVFDLPDLFNPTYLHLADINGTGASDVLYLGQNRFRAWLNLSGNGWGPGADWDAFPDTALMNQVAVVDLLGHGTACIVWSSPLPQNAVNPMRYIDLMGGNKPYLLTGYDNGSGKTVDFAYKESTYFYLQDKLNGTPWITKLPFPVHCIVQTTVSDAVSGTSYTNNYSYHHGYYDHAEKEFRGFGRVDNVDIESYDTETADPFDQVSMLTKTWYHTGVYFGADKILGLFAAEYFQNTSMSEYQLPEPFLPAGLTDIELREAARACKGMTLRQEVYALDSAQNPGIAAFPYTAVEHNCNIILLQPLLSNMYTVFLNVESENIAYHYERNPADPRIAHTLNTAIDPVYGFILDSFSVVYPRLPVIDLSKPGGLPIPCNQQLPLLVLNEQQKLYITLNTHSYTNAINDSSAYRLPVLCETVTSQANGIAPQNQYFTVQELAAYALNPVQPSGTLQLNKLQHHRTLFLADDLQTPLTLGTIDPLGFTYQNYQLAFDNTILEVYGGLTAAQMLTDGKYIEASQYITQGLFPAADAPGEWWVPSGTVLYLDNNTPLPFYLPYQYVDTFGHITTLAYDPNWLLIRETIDPIGNTMTVSNFDYRVLAPQMVVDINKNITEVSFDIHGLVAGIAMEGKGNGTEGDNLVGFEPDADPGSFFDDPYANGASLLGNATLRYVYDYSVIPARSASLVRENHLYHFTDPRLDIDPAAIQFSFEYTDGMGRSAMKKIQAENTPTPASGADCGTDTSASRWIGLGKTVYNNKGTAVKQYEPFFSNTNAYEEAPANGVTPIMFFDPLGRAMKTTFPDGTFSSVSFDPWMEISYDRNDQVLNSDWYAARQDPANPLSHNQWEVDASVKTAVHNGTPGIQHLDALGRGFYSVILNLAKAGDPVTAIATYSVLDIVGNPLQVIDARLNTVMTHEFDYLNRPIKQVSSDAGTKWTLNDSLNKSYYKWDSNKGENIIFLTDYDALHRPVNSYITIGNAVPGIFEHIIYGENISVGGNADTDNNLRGQVYKHYDSAGLLTHSLYDFKGNLVQGSRIFTQTYQPANNSGLLQPVMWTGNPAIDDPQLEGVEFVSITEADAINRPLMIIRSFKTAAPAPVISPPYNAAAINNADIIVHSYALSGHLQRVDVYKAGGTTATNYVSRICHNEKGMRLCIQYGNNTVTRYTYDTFTFRLTRLLTTRNKGVDILQDTSYYYDPVGNITHQADAAQQTLYFNNQIIPPDSDYTYDAIYRLITTKGREHIGQGLPPSCTDSMRMQNAQPGNGNQMQNYIQNYTYDNVGNMLEMANQNSWSRVFTYDIGTNRLLGTNPGDTSSGAVNYNYDTHGNMLNMEHLNAMDWNFKDELQHLGLVGGGDAYYMYDSSGHRIRKVWVKNPNLICERRYLGEYELYREYNSSGQVTLERESLNVMDDTSRIALIENLTIGDDGSVPFLVRYQYSNHLGSAMLELDDLAAIITYEEYYAFGSTSYQATDTSREVPKKRYRFSGKERDEETGLNYHDARYYAPWLARWTATDPIGIQDGPNVYCYTKNNPVMYSDKSGAIGAAEGAINAAPEVPTLGKSILGAVKKYQEVLTQGYGEISASETVLTTRTIFQKAAGGADYADIISQFNVSTKTFLGTGETNQLIRTVGKFKKLGLGAAVRADDFANFTRNYGPLKDFKLNILHPETVKQLEAGIAFEKTPIGSQIVKAAKSVGLKLSNVNAEGKVIGRFSVGGATGQFENAAGLLAKYRRGSLAASGAAVKLLGKAPIIGKITAPLAKVAAPVFRVAGKIAGPLAIGIGIVQIVTAKTNSERVQAGADTLAGAAAFAGPVGTAFSLGYTGGQLLDKGAEYATKKVFGKDYSPSSLISSGLTSADEHLTKLWADPNKPAYTQTIGWKLANWLD